MGSFVNHTFLNFLKLTYLFFIEQQKINKLILESYKVIKSETYKVAISNPSGKNFIHGWGGWLNIIVSRKGCENNGQQSICFFLLIIRSIINCGNFCQHCSTLVNIFPSGMVTRNPKGRSFSERGTICCQTVSWWTVIWMFDRGPHLFWQLRN